MNTKIIDRVAIEAANKLNLAVMNALAVDDYNAAEIAGTARDMMTARAYGIDVSQLPALRIAQRDEYRTVFARRS